MPCSTWYIFDSIHIQICRKEESITSRKWGTINVSFIVSVHRRYSISPWHFVTRLKCDRKSNDSIIDKPDNRWHWWEWRTIRSIRLLRCSQVDLPHNVFTETLLEKPAKYVKYFDYPLPELLVDQSTDPMQNTTRQYVKASTFLSNHFSEGRFADHQMIIRRQGETSILRPRQDPVLANGFTPVIRPSSLLPSYKAMDPPPSTSMTKKLSVPKPEQKLKRKVRQKKAHRRLEQSTPQLNQLIEELVNWCSSLALELLPFLIVSSALMSMRGTNSSPIQRILLHDRPTSSMR